MTRSIDEKKLAWQCRRGTRELDRMTLYYLEHHYREAGEEEQSAFRKLLELPDPQLYSALLGKAGELDPITDKITRLIREDCGHRVT